MGCAILAGRFTESSHLQRFFLLVALAQSCPLLACHARAHNAKRFIITISIQLGGKKKKKKEKKTAIG